MSDEIPRRSKPKNAPPPVSGYRATKRSSKSAKSAKRAETVDQVVQTASRAGKTARDIGYYLALGVGGLLGLVLVLLLLGYAINGIARWNALRKGDLAGTQAELERKSRENVLAIGVKDGQAVGFLALRVDGKGKQIYGIAIPDGAFIEVPGQGFERAGESYSAGPDVALSAVSNYLTVPFHNYVVIPGSAYTDAVKNQSAANIGAAVTDTNMSTDDLAALSHDMGTITQKNTAIVPLPVKPVKLGSQTYFEPQKADVADLLKSWWGVDPNKAAKVTRVILYNGAGTPGIAGEAAQQLIRTGFRVIDTKNADNFNYQTTQIVVQRGSDQQGKDIAKVLGVGTVKREPSDQDVAEVIVIVGKDYKPPAGESQGGTQ